MDFLVPRRADPFRVNIVESFGAGVCRSGGFEAIKDFSAYNLPANSINIAENARGLVVMSGSTGSGKTTSIAAMLEPRQNTFTARSSRSRTRSSTSITPKKSDQSSSSRSARGHPNEDIALRNLAAWTRTRARR